MMIMMCFVFRSGETALHIIIANNDEPIAKLLAEEFISVSKIILKNYNSYVVSLLDRMQYTHIHTDTQIHTYTYTHIHIHTHNHTHNHTHTRAHTKEERRIYLIIFLTLFSLSLLTLTFLLSHLSQYLNIFFLFLL
jgi:hypothetical protein